MGAKSQPGGSTREGRTQGDGAKRRLDCALAPSIPSNLRPLCAISVHLLSTLRPLRPLFVHSVRAPSTLRPSSVQPPSIYVPSPSSLRPAFRDPGIISVHSPSIAFTSRPLSLQAPSTFCPLSVHLCPLSVHSSSNLCVFRPISSYYTEFRRRFAPSPPKLRVI